MKTSLIFLIFFSALMGFSQNNHIVKTEDGRRVLLKADYTWEYIDAASPQAAPVVKETASPDKASDCALASDFVEPELDKNVQMQLKRGRATIKHIKKKVAEDYECEVEDVVLLAVSEEKAFGTYDFCANGTKVAYKRNGHTIVKKGQFF